MRSLLRALTRWLSTPLFTLALLCIHCGSSVDAGPGANGDSTTGEGGGSASTAAGGTTGEGGSSTGESGSNSTGEGGSSTGEGGSSSTGEGGGGCLPPEDTAVFEVGTGETCFVRIDDGATLPVMAGPQGGYHLWLAVGCRGCGAAVRLRYSVKDPATGELFESGAAQEMVLTFLPGDIPQAAGLPARLPGAIWNPDSVLPQGTHVLLAAEVRNDDGSTKHAAEVEVVLGATEAWGGVRCSEDPATCGAPGGTPCCTD
ncbi:hypothetical protein WMF37_00545 [Sorangium sp. So ce291]|uniref:hypothetical protein n=1 Tax=Sorangium sp. So ce291 TaxID=3133294 RepID=UPI003F636C73